VIGVGAWYPLLTTREPVTMMSPSVEEADSRSADAAGSSDSVCDWPGVPVGAVPATASSGTVPRPAGAVCAAALVALMAMMEQHASMLMSFKTSLSLARTFDPPGPRALRILGYRWQGMAAGRLIIFLTDEQECL
jgi:hypothetical protein